MIWLAILFGARRGGYVVVQPGRVMTRRTRAPAQPTRSSTWGWSGSAKAVTVTVTVVVACSWLPTRVSYVSR